MPSAADLFVAFVGVVAAAWVLLEFVALAIDHKNRARFDRRDPWHWRAAIGFAVSVLALPALAVALFVK